MSKKIIYAFLLALIFLLTACRGERSVKVKINYPNEGWYGWMLADNDGNTLNISGLPPVVIPPGVSPYFPAGATIYENFDSRTIDLGDDYSHIKLWLMRLTQPVGGAQKLEVSIVEEYKAGFLYTATSDIVAEASNNTSNMNLPVVIDYDFSTAEK